MVVEKFVEFKEPGRKKKNLTQRRKDAKTQRLGLRESRFLELASLGVGEWERPPLPREGG
jgi:hypothetical protein